MIWLSLLLLFVRCLSPTKPAGLALSNKFLQADSKLAAEGRRHNKNEKKIHEKNSEKFSENFSENFSYVRLGHEFFS
jgi:hypothetical protein